MKRGRMLMGFVLVMTAVALAVALAIGLSGGGGERAKPLLPYAVVKVVSGWCKQNRDAGYVDTWVLVRNVGRSPYPETQSPWHMPIYKYHYNDGSDAWDSPEPTMPATVPVGQTAWLHFFDVT